MSNRKRERNPRANRPTDSFGGPNNRRTSISFTVTLAAIAIFLLIQWTGGDLGPLLNGSATLPPTGAPPATRPSTPVVDNSNSSNNAGEAATPVAQATTERATQTPSPTHTIQAQSIQTPRATTQPTPTANAPPTAPPAARASDLPTIAYADLPPEAQDTIALIERGGPFPFRRDGVTFQNRERLLPRHPEGYYREYTVITPGEDDRGARRIVTGKAGEMYYTADHYASFREIIR